MDLLRLTGLDVAPHPYYWSVCSKDQMDLFSTGHMLLYQFHWTLESTVGSSWHYVFLFVLIYVDVHLDSSSRHDDILWVSIEAALF